MDFGVARDLLVLILLGVGLDDVFGVEFVEGFGDSLEVFLGKVDGRRIDRRRLETCGVEGMVSGVRVRGDEVVMQLC